MDVSLLALACALCWVPVGDHSSEHAQASKQDVLSPFGLLKKSRLGGDKCLGRDNKQYMAESGFK